MTAGRASVRLIRLSGTVCPTDRSLNLQSPNKAGDVVQLVRTLPCHGRGREFESRRPRQLSKEVMAFCLKPMRVQKDTFLHPFCTLYRPLKPFYEHGSNHWLHSSKNDGVGSRIED